MPLPVAAASGGPGIAIGIIALVVGLVIFKQAQATKKHGWKRRPAARRPR